MLRSLELSFLCRRTPLEHHHKRALNIITMKGKECLWSKYVRLVGAVDRKVNHGLGALGNVVAQRPIITLVLSLLAALGLSGGMALVCSNIKTDSDQLWCADSALMMLVALPGPYGSQPALRSAVYRLQMHYTRTRARTSRNLSCITAA